MRMHTNFLLRLVRPGVIHSIKKFGSFVGIGITGTGCQNPQAGTVVRVCFSGRVDDCQNTDADREAVVVLLPPVPLTVTMSE